MKLYLVIAVVLSLCLFDVSNAQCFMGGRCVDENTGTRYSDGDSWKNMETCQDCSCSQTKRLLKTCVVRDVGLSDTTFDQEIIVDSNMADAVENNQLFKCKKITAKRVSKLPKKRVMRFYTMEDRLSCCSLLFTPSGFGEDCVANKVEGECRYEVVNKETGDACEVFAMVGRK